MCDTFLLAQLNSIEARARDLGLWPGTQGPEIELYLPGMTPGVDDPILTPGGLVPFDSIVVLRAQGKTIQYFSEFDDPDFVQDPKDSSVGRIQVSDSTSITLDDPFGCEFSVKARTFDAVTGHSGLTELSLVIE